jgi:hypothetical protein
MQIENEIAKKNNRMEKFLKNGKNVRLLSKLVFLDALAYLCAHFIPFSFFFFLFFFS